MCQVVGGAGEHAQSCPRDDRALDRSNSCYKLQHMLQPWLLLLLSLPPQPSSLRVRTWRKLRALGAVALKSGAYLLPFSPDRYEQFQWLAQAVQKDRGEATLLKVDRVENMKQPDIVRLFQ